MALKTRFETFIDRLFYNLLILVPFLFPFPSYKTLNITTGLLVVLWIIKGGVVYLKVALRDRLLLLFISTYLIFVVGLLFSDNIKDGGVILEKRLYVLLFPLILSTVKISEQQVRAILLSFISTCVFASIISLYQTLPLLFDRAITASIFREQFGKTLNLHPVYYSTYITFSIFVLFYFLLSKTLRFTLLIKSCIVLLIIYLSFIDVLLSSRMALIALGLFLVLLYFKFWKNHRWVGTIIALVLTVAVANLIAKVDFLNSRFYEMKQTKWAAPRGIHHDATNIRIGIYECALPLLKKNWVLGLGTGSVQDDLNECYRVNEFSELMYVDGYNTHNEYLNVWLNVGVVGFVIFLLSLLLPLSKAIKRRNYLYLAFLALMMLEFLTENVLERNKGIIFFAFFNSLFAFNSKNWSFK